MAAKPQNRYADGGQMPGPTMGIQYADGGTIATSSDPNSPANLDTPTAGQNFGDYLRQQSAGGQGVGLQYAPVTEAPPTTPAYANTKGGNSTPGGNTAAPASDGTGVADGTSGKIASTVGTLAFGPVIGGLMGFGTNVADGYSTGTTSGNSPASATFGANLSQFGPITAGMNALFGTPLADAPAANPVAADPATMQGATISTNTDPAFATATNTFAANPTQADPATQQGQAPTGGAPAGIGPNGMTGMDGNPGKSADDGGGNGNGGGGGGGGNAGPHGGEGSGTGGAGYADGGLTGAQQPQQPMPVQQGANPTMATAGLQMAPAGASAGSPPPDMHPAIAALHVQNKLANPQVMQAIQTDMSQAIQSGQVNPQQLQMLGQLAQSAMQNPELWPKLRQFAIQAGLPDAPQLPQQFNQQLCMALMAVSQAAQHGDRQGAFKNGGMLHGPGTGTSDSIQAHNTDSGQAVKLSNGEYIIPADVVATKGKEFFDNIVRKYHTPAAMQPR